MLLFPPITFPPPANPTHVTSPPFFFFYSFRPGKLGNGVIFFPLPFHESVLGFQSPLFFLELYEHPPTFLLFSCFDFLLPLKGFSFFSLSPMAITRSPVLLSPFAPLKSLSCLISRRNSPPLLLPFYVYVIAFRTPFPSPSTHDTPQVSFFFSCVPLYQREIQTPPPFYPDPAGVVTPSPLSLPFLRCVLTAPFFLPPLSRTFTKPKAAFFFFFPPTDGRPLLLQSGRIQEKRKIFFFFPFSPFSLFFSSFFSFFFFLRRRLLFSLLPSDQLAESDVLFFQPFFLFYGCRPAFWFFPSRFSFVGRRHGVPFFSPPLCVVVGKSLLDSFPFTRTVSTLWV